MRIAICDDDLLIQEQLQKYLREYFERNHLKYPGVVTFNNGESLLKDTTEKDIVFLDVEMPGISGIFVGNELKKSNPNVIIFIVTSFVEYLDEAMRFQVFRYLTKPIDKGRLFRNMKDALQIYTASNIKIPIETKQGIHAVSASDIVSIEAETRKVIVHTITNDYESVHNMAYWTQTLNAHCFFQTHRSFIVNLSHVTKFDHTLVYLYNNQLKAYLTRRKYTQFKEAYLLYLESIRSL